MSDYVNEVSNQVDAMARLLQLSVLQVVNNFRDERLLTFCSNNGLTFEAVPHCKWVFRKGSDLILQNGRSCSKIYPSNPYEVEGMYDIWNVLSLETPLGQLGTFVENVS